LSKLLFEGRNLKGLGKTSMEADILRLILFFVGAAIIFGIYAADRYKRNVQDEPSRDWTSQSEIEDALGHIEPRWDRLYEPEDNQVEDDSLAGESFGEQYQSDIEDSHQEPYIEEEIEESVSERMDDVISSELEHLEEIIHEDPRYEPESSFETDTNMPREQMSISFLTRDMRQDRPREDVLDLPTKIIQLTIVPHAEQFYGDDIQSVANEVGLEPGDMDIFHHYGDNPEKHQAIYSMASMVEPGTFPMDDMDNFSTPGVTIFSQLPGPKDGLTIFADMLYGAEQLANLLDGELRDETHSAITKQTICHIREDIQEYHRQLQLARSKR
jgi:cell division protein ZipA